ncbi:MAG: hypothetical protein DRI54_05095 [Bacteroidetes bacterium]|nr:MAG: hypothetical protein DRI54_05095 [Bacteroidota bacterium]
MNDLTKKFSKATIWVHWLTAIIILTLFPLGKYMTGLESGDKMGLIKLHAGLGILVLLLTIYRSFIFFKHERPEDLKTGSKFNDRLAVWIHNAFYFLIIAIGISGVAVLATGGYIDAFDGNAGLIKSPEDIPPLKAHGFLSLTLMIFLALHVLGFIKHYFLTKENTLKRVF